MAGPGGRLAPASEWTTPRSPLSNPGSARMLARRAVASQAMSEWPVHKNTHPVFDPYSPSVGTVTRRRDHLGLHAAPLASDSMPLSSVDVPDRPADIRADSQTFRRAFQDLRDGFRQRELWLNLGWQDIKQRYRRSVLGPFWITIATGVQATAMGLLYAFLLHVPLDFLLPYVTVGLIVWTMISASILEGSEVFIANEGLIKQLPSALSVHVYRLVWRQLLLFAHNLVIYVILLFLFGVWRHLTWPDLAAIPAFGLLVLNTLWASILFGIFATRHRDIAPILSSLTLLLFVLTPVMWTTQALEDRAAERARIAEINPLYHYLEIIRAPLLGQDQRAYHWYIVLGCTAAGWALAIYALRKYRSRVPYWV